MITPEEIKKQAERWYKDFLIASINGESFFPKEIRFGRIRSSETLESFSKINQEIQNLKKKNRRNNQAMAIL